MISGKTNYVGTSPTSVRCFIEDETGNPRRGFPTQKQSHRTVFAPFLRFLRKKVSHSAECDKGLCPFETHELLKKLDQNFYICLSRQILIYHKNKTSFFRMSCCINSELFCCVVIKVTLNKDDRSTLVT